MPSLLAPGDPLYEPIVGVEPRCRRCWGLSYESQSWSYKPTGPFGPLFGPVAYVTTLNRREERRLAAQTRYKERRPFLRRIMEDPHSTRGESDGQAKDHY